MAKITGTNIWYKCYKIHGKSKFTYSIGINDPLTPFWKSSDMNRFSHFKPDAFNQKKIDFGFYKVSIAELPLAPAIHTTTNSIPAITQKKITSRFLHRTKIVDIVQFGDLSKNQKRELIIILDGNVYINFNEMISGIQSLVIDKKVKPLVVAFIHTGFPDRQQELACNPDFTSFLAEELIPGLDSLGNISHDNITLSGSSMGGLAATFAAYQKPVIFKNVIAQSSSYQWKSDIEKDYEWIVRKFETSQKLPVRFFLTTGLFETEKREHVSQLEINRKMSKLLKNKGYEVTYTEYEGGHDYLYWQYFLIQGIKDIYTIRNK